MSATATVRKVPTSGSPAPRTGSYKPPSISKGSKVTAVNGNSSPAPSKDTKKTTTKETSPSNKTAPSGAPFSAKQAALKRVNTSDISDLELENAAAMNDLRSQLEASEVKAETAASDFANQMKALQLRLDDAMSEQAKMEETLHARESTIEQMEKEVKELSRNKKDQEKIMESEREAFCHEKEEMIEKEQTLNTIIEQLKKALSSKDKSDSEPRSPSAKSADEQVDNALDEFKEKLVSSLRLELAEAQIRLTEAEQLGGVKLREAEEKLLEARMANARLTEDNESFQLLLGQATMNGEFAKGELLSHYNLDSSPSSPKMGHSPKGSLAGELENAVGKDAEEYKKLEAEVRSLKDQNKALTLYINKIIGRLLQSGMEDILDKTPENERHRERNKELPPTPEEGDANSMPPPPLMLNRTRSLAQRKPMNIKPIPIATPGAAGENARPLGRSVSVSSGRGHRRSHSDAPYSPPAGRNDPQNQPGSRQTMFYNSNPLQRTGTFPTTPSATGSTSSSNSFTSNENGDIITPTNTTPSPPHTSTTTGPISGKALRPLSLLGQGPPALKSPLMMSPRKTSIGSDVFDDDTASKKNKRTSWIGGWFNKGGKEEDLPSVAENSIASTLAAEE